MAREASHLYGLLALLDPLLGRAPFVIEPYHRPARRLQIGHDEAYSREQLPSVKLHFRHHTPRSLPTRGLVEEALVPHHRLVAWSSHGPRQQLHDVALQTEMGKCISKAVRVEIRQVGADERSAEYLADGRGAAPVLPFQTHSQAFSRQIMPLLFLDIALECAHRICVARG